MNKNLLLTILISLLINTNTFASIYFPAKKIIRIEAVSHPSYDGAFIQFDSPINTGAECSPSIETDTVYLDRTSLANYNSILSIALAAYSTSKPVRVVTGGCGELQNSETVIKPTAVRIHGISAGQ